MREIKFRVWDGINYMSNPFTLNDLQSKTLQFTTDCVVMQFTGLTDKNGKEVYEGDIIQWPHLKGHDIPVIVYFNDSEFVFVGKPINPQSETESWLDNKCEVIGNIYENPELLNQ